MGVHLPPTDPRSARASARRDANDPTAVKPTRSVEAAAAGIDAARPLDPTHFLRLVARLVAYVDTAADRRAVVLACTRLLAFADRDSRRLEAAFEEGGFTAIHYLGLGEISAAADLVLLNIGAEAAVANPYAGAAVIHISAPRLQMLAAGRRDLIGGASVFGRMQAHVAGCAACRLAASRVTR